MLKIIHRGIQFNSRINPAWYTAPAGFIQEAPSNPNLLALKAGSIVTTGADGFVKLADGLTDEAIRFLVKDAISGFYENKPALASGNVATTHGPLVAITDQIDTTETFAPGDKLYIGSGAKAGLLTKTAPASGPKKVFGVADSSASAANPELTVLVL